MNVRVRRPSQRFLPVVGGMTAVATATGMFAPVAQIAPAGAQADGAGSTLGTAGLVGAGTFESCSAYFGFGKDEGVLGVVEFDVADVNGDDGVAHDVEDDTTVRLVLENTEGEELECVPFEITEEQWDAEFGGDDTLPPYPGPNHYAYPSVNLAPEIEGFGEVEAVGFRVTGFPAGHSLVSPEGVRELDPIFLDPEEVFFGEIIDQRVLDFLTTEVSAVVSGAYEDALVACDAGDEIDATDPDLLAAVNALGELTGNGEDFTEVDCFDVDVLHTLGSFWLGVFASVEYVEEIRLALPEAPPTAPPTAPPAAPPAPAAQPTTATPRFTG